VKSKFQLSYADVVSKYTEMKVQEDELVKRTEVNNSVCQDAQEVFIDSSKGQARIGNHPQAYNLPCSTNNTCTANSSHNATIYQTQLQTYPNLNLSTILNRPNLNDMEASTPAKTFMNQMLPTNQPSIQTLTTVFEEKDFPPLKSSKVIDTELFEKLMDKFFKFLINLFQDLLPFDCILNKFKSFVSSLNENKVKNLRGASFL